MPGKKNPIGYPGGERWNQQNVLLHCRWEEKMENNFLVSGLGNLVDDGTIYWERKWKYLFVIYRFYNHLNTNGTYSHSKDSKSPILKLSCLLFDKLLESKTKFLLVFFFLQISLLKYNTYCNITLLLKFTIQWFFVCVFTELNNHSCYLILEPFHQPWKKPQTH